MREDIKDIVYDLSKGIPGAVSVLAEIRAELGEESFLNLARRFKRVNLTGSAIWIGYKDHCGEDLTTFLLAFQATPTALFGTINKELGGPVVGEFIDRKGAIAHTKEKLG